MEVGGAVFNPSETSVAGGAKHDGNGGNDGGGGGDGAFEGKASRKRTSNELLMERRSCEANLLRDMAVPECLSSMDFTCWWRLARLYAVTPVYKEVNQRQPM